MTANYSILIFQNEIFFNFLYFYIPSRFYFPSRSIHIIILNLLRCPHFLRRFELVQVTLLIFIIFSPFYLWLDILLQLLLFPSVLINVIRVPLLLQWIKVFLSIESWAIWISYLIVGISSWCNLTNRVWNLFLRFIQAIPFVLGRSFKFSTWMERTFSPWLQNRYLLWVYLYFLYLHFIFFLISPGLRNWP